MKPPGANEIRGNWTTLLLPINEEAERLRPVARETLPELF